MKPTLQLRLGQQLTLTPQLRLAIRLLQLSAAELELEINEAVDSNPLLEREEDDPDVPPFETNDSAPEIDSERPLEAAAETIEAFDDVADFRWDDDRPAGSGTGAEGEDRDEGRAAPLDLHEHLSWQLHLSHLNARDVLIGEALIEAIDEDGYLHVPFADVQAALLPELAAPDSDIETVLHLIQHFDPVGVGARSLSECLCVQLGLLSLDTPGLVLARLIASKHLDSLARHGAAKLAAQLHESVGAVDCAVGLLRSLDPKPGDRHGVHVRR